MLFEMERSWLFPVGPCKVPLGTYREKPQPLQLLVNLGCS